MAGNAVLFSDSDSPSSSREGSPSATKNLPFVDRYCQQPSPFMTSWHVHADGPHLNQGRAEENGILSFDRAGVGGWAGANDSREVVGLGPPCFITWKYSTAPHIFQIIKSVDSTTKFSHPQGQDAVPNSDPFRGPARAARMIREEPTRQRGPGLGTLSPRAKNETRTPKLGLAKPTC